MKINPILNKELRSSSRSIKFPISIAIFLLVLIFFNLASTVSSFGFERYNYVNFLSANISNYTTIIVIEILLILFVVPSISASSISGERERQTLDLLLVTKLTPTSIILGKLATSLSRVLLLMVISLPILASLLSIIGISFIHIVEITLFCLSLSILVGSVSIMFSTIFKRTTISTILSYGFVMFIIIAPIVLIGIGSAIVMSTMNNVGSNHDDYNFLFQIAYFIMSFCPIASVSSLLSSQIGSMGATQYGGMYGGGFINIFTSLMGGLGYGVQPMIPIWAISIVANLLLSILFIFIAIKRLNPIK